MKWQLVLHRDVVAYLVSLREAGKALRDAVFSLEDLVDIPSGGEVTRIDQDVFMWVIHDHVITYEVVRDHHRILLPKIHKMEEKDTNN